MHYCSAMQFWFLVSISIKCRMENKQSLKFLQLTMVSIIQITSPCQIFYLKDFQPSWSCVKTVIGHLFSSVQFFHLNSGCLKNAYLSLSLIFFKGELFLRCLLVHLVYKSREFIPGIDRQNFSKQSDFCRYLVFISYLFILFRRDTHEIFAQPVDRDEVGSFIVVLLLEFLYFFLSHNVDASLVLQGGGLLQYHSRANGLWHNESETSRGNLHHFGTI